MSNSDQLSLVVAAFEQWRLSKNGRPTATPLPLRHQAVALLDSYAACNIVKALRLSGSQLKSWASASSVCAQPPVFVHLPLTSAPSHPAFSVALHFRQGGQLMLSGDISPQLLGMLVREMNT